MIPDVSNAPLVSVIIPAYRRADFVNQAVASVLRQTFTDYELLVVDDGSGDATVAQYDLPPPARLIRRAENAGRPSVPRNDGYRVSRGKYLAFLDMDDTWAPDKLESQVAILESDPEIGVTFCHYTLVDESLRPLTKQPPPPSPIADALVAMIRLDYMLSPSFTLIRRTSLEREGIFDEELPSAEDWDLLLRLARSSRFSVDPTPRVFYRTHAEQRSSHRLRRGRVGVTVIEKTLAWVTESRPDLLPLVRRQAARRYNRWAGAQMEAGVPASAVRETLRQALSYDPWNLRVWCRRAALGLYGLRTGEDRA